MKLSSLRHSVPWGEENRFVSARPTSPSVIAHGQLVGWRLDESLGGHPLLIKE